MFAGSMEHLMRDLFSAEDRALSQFGSFYALGPITAEEWEQGIRERLALMGAAARRGQWLVIDLSYADTSARLRLKGPSSSRRRGGPPHPPEVAAARPPGASRRSSFALASVPSPPVPVGEIDMPTARRRAHPRAWIESPSPRWSHPERPWRTSQPGIFDRTMARPRSGVASSRSFASPAPAPGPAGRRLCSFRP
jgi:hypothetical protein